MGGCTGVVAEYNPFHNGHRHQLERARSVTGASHIVAVMSGSFVQRGETAMFHKRLRARWALLNGADLVLQLPAVYSCAPAERFAEGAIRILHGTGLVDALCFGSESGEIEEVQRLAKLGQEEAEGFKLGLRGYLKEGYSFPRARAAMLEKEHGAALGTAFSLPNDILGAEYLRAIEKFAPDMRAFAVKRIGAAHDAEGISGAMASASALRQALLKNDHPALRACMPQNVYESLLQEVEAGLAPFVQDRLDLAILYRLRAMTREELSNLPDVSEGLENTLFRTAREASAYEELLALLKTKRYTHARLRRILTYALLGIEKGVFDAVQPYIRVLGVKKTALPLLSELAKSATLPVITRFSDTEALIGGARLLHELDMRASDIASLALPQKKSAPFDYGAQLLIV